MQTYESDANIGNIKILAVDMDKTLLTDERVLPQGLDERLEDVYKRQARPLAGIPPSGARTFLTRTASSTSRDRLAHSAVQECNTPLPQAMAQRKRSTR